MKLKRLLSLAGFIAALLIFNGGRLYAVDAIAVGNAQAFAGGYDTVDVFVTTDDAYPAVEITLNFDLTKFSCDTFFINPNAWNTAWGQPDLVRDSVSVAGKLKVKVGFFSLSDLTAKVPKTATSLRLFSVVMKVKTGVATATEIVTSSGVFATPISLAPKDIAGGSGSFLIQSGYIITADSVEGSFGLALPVDISLTNVSNVVGVQFALQIDTTQLQYADSVELNTAAWQGGTPLKEVTVAKDTIKVTIYTLSLAVIPPSNTPRVIAKVYLRPATGAIEKDSNPLTLTTGIVATPAENTASYVHGNFAIKGKHSLRVSRDAAAPLGGVDTIRVYLKNAESVIAVEAELTVTASNFTFSKSDIVFNKAVFSGSASNVQVEDTLTTSKIKIVAYPLSLDSIAAQETEKLLFKVALHVKTTAAAGVYDSVAITGAVTAKDLQLVPVTALTKGVFQIRSPFEYQVRSVTGNPKTSKTINILFTNRDEVIGAEVVLKFDQDSLKFVAGSAVANGSIWTGGAPTMEELAGTDSVKIIFYDLTGTKKIPAGGSAQTLVSLTFQIDSSLVNGDTAWIRPTSGVVAITGAIPMTAGAVKGYFAVLQDLMPTGPVSDVTATAGTNTITIGWKNPADADLAKVTIVRKAAAGDITVYEKAAVPGATESFIDETVAAGISYRYVLTAWDPADNASDTVSTAAVSVGPISQTSDINGDGVWDAKDLFAYLLNPTLVNVDTLAALIAKLLSQPAPATLLASAQNIAVSDMTGTDGAALISLNTESEIILARFTFSYDKSYQVEAVEVNRSLGNKVLFKQIVQDGKLIVDLISLTGLAPEELGEKVLSIRFRDASYEQARLQLEKVEVADRDGTVRVIQAAKVSALKALPKAFSLSQNSPNPFNPSTTIAFEIPEGKAAVRVNLTVYNIRGQKVVTLMDELKDAGSYLVNWDGITTGGTKVSSGVYFYRIQAGEFSAVRKMVVLK